MPERELWQGERDQRWQVMERMEEDRAARERHARGSAATGGDAAADYRQRLAEQGFATDPRERGGRDADARLADAIRRRIEEDGHGAADGITVDAAAGEVTLTGTVASHAAHRRVRAVVEQVRGVSRIADRLRVR